LKRAVDDGVRDRQLAQEGERRRGRLGAEPALVAKLERDVVPGLLDGARDLRPPGCAAGAPGRKLEMDQAELARGAQRQQRVAKAQPQLFADLGRYAAVEE
jgi:hypothetical protein